MKALQDQVRECENLTIVQSTTKAKFQVDLTKDPSIPIETVITTIKSSISTASQSWEVDLDKHRREMEAQWDIERKQFAEEL